jgi:alpha-L-fucosidase
MPLSTEDSQYLYTEASRLIGVEDGDPLSLTRRQTYVRQKFGSLICWATPTFTGTWTPTPDLDPDTVWAPTGLDIDSWVDACVAARMKYAVLVTQHHDGFALWPTDYVEPAHSPYSIESTSWYESAGHPDIIGDFVTKFRAAGIQPGLYYSIWNTTLEARLGILPQSHPAAYLGCIDQQLTELLTWYGEIESLWFDGWGWQCGYDQLTYSHLYHLIKSLSPECAIVENGHEHPALHSEIEEYEYNPGAEGSLPNGNTRLCEEVTTPRTDGDWYYTATHDQSASAYKTAASLIAERTRVGANSGTFMLALIPNQAGAIASPQAALYAALG